MKNFFKNKTAVKISSFVLILAMLNVSVGCNYYKVSTADTVSNGLKEIDEDRFLVVHFQVESYGLHALKFDQENQRLTGFKRSIPVEHQGHDQPQAAGNRFKPRLESPTNEIHIYITDYRTLEDGTISIPVESIKRVDIYDYQVGATIASYVFTTIGILAGLYLIVLIIVLLTKSSCPFVYTFDGDMYRFQGEMFGGAISENMQRDDYMPLPGFSQYEGQFRIKITNELKERQYTDVAELYYFEHMPGIQILFDQKGSLYTVRNPEVPIRARTDEGTDLLDMVTKKDSLTYDFRGESSEANDLGAVQMSFSKPDKTKTAKLLLTLKNSLWLDYIYGKFIEQFGEKYEVFAEKQKNVPAEKKRQWMIDQSMLLSVKVRTKIGWKQVDNLNVIGPLAQRDVIVPIDLDGLDEEVLEIRLESGYHFWEIDYAAIDFSENENVSQAIIKANTASDENDIDIVQALLNSDGNFLSQLNVGNEAYISFAAPKLKNKAKEFSVILHTKGYYEYIREFKGKPNIEELKSFRKKGAFPKFAKSKFVEISPAL
ncbi:MAG: hypothetical protein ACK47F_11000 [Flavobacteriales bacterium]|jgi:hypothetical protein